jgi:ribosomal peptide maturation radical SAM protein 1
LPEGVFGPVHRKVGYPHTLHGDKVPRAMIGNLDCVPQPDYHEYFAELNQSTSQDRVLPGLLIETSRGCWWGERSHCTFCGLNGSSMKFRSRSAESVLSELQSASESYGLVKFEAVDNILDMQYFETLLTKLKTGDKGYQIFYEIKSNIKKYQVQLLAEAGVRWAQPGIESFDTRILRLMKKGVSGRQNVALLKWCRQFGIRVYWNVIYGTPGEQDAWYDEQSAVMPLLEHFEPGTPVQLQYIRYSPYHGNPHAFQLDLVPAEAYRYVYPLSELELEDLAYFFDERPVDEKQPGDQRRNAAAGEERSGARKFMTAIALWRRAWLRETPPICCLVNKDGTFVVVDTRRCAIEPLTELDELGVAILDAAEDGNTLDQLRSSILHLAENRSELVESRIKMLTERGFLLAMDGRVLSVVLRAPVRPLPDESEFPGGFILESEKAKLADTF